MAWITGQQGHMTVVTAPSSITHAATVLDVTDYNGNHISSEDFDLMFLTGFQHKTGANYSIQDTLDDDTYYQEFGDKATIVKIQGIAVKMSTGGGISSVSLDGDDGYDQLANFYEDNRAIGRGAGNDTFRRIEMKFGDNNWKNGLLMDMTVSWDVSRSRGGPIYEFQMTVLATESLWT